MCFTRSCKMDHIPEHVNYDFALCPIKAEDWNVLEKLQIGNTLLVRFSTELQLLLLQQFMDMIEVA